MIDVGMGEEWVTREEAEIERARARRTDPGTSHAAAKSLGDVRPSQRFVLRALKRLGAATDEQLVSYYTECADNFPSVPAQSPSGIRTRRRELTDAKLVIDTGKRRRLKSGRRAIVWKVAP